MGFASLTWKRCWLPCLHPGDRPHPVGAEVPATRASWGRRRRKAPCTVLSLTSGCSGKPGPQLYHPLNGDNCASSSGICTDQININYHEYVCV